MATRPMRLYSDSFSNFATIPRRLCFGQPDGAGRTALSDNRSPHFGWSDVPDATRSLALLCCDPDVPSVGDDVQQPDRHVAADLPRVDFFHLVLVDLDPAIGGLSEGGLSRAVTKGGKAGPQTAFGARVGVNDYTGYFAEDVAMAGDYYGYDGPCPPWNDRRVHRYVFTLYALTCARLPLEGRFDGRDVIAALEGLVLAQASWTGKYTLNAELRG